MGFILGLCVGAIVVALLYDLSYRHEREETEWLRAENTRLLQFDRRPNSLYTGNNDGLFRDIEEHLRRALLESQAQEGEEPAGGLPHVQAPQDERCQE